MTGLFSPKRFSPIVVGMSSSNSSNRNSSSNNSSNSNRSPEVPFVLGETLTQPEIFNNYILRLIKFLKTKFPIQGPTDPPSLEGIYTDTTNKRRVLIYIRYHGAVFKIDYGMPVTHNFPFLKIFPGMQAERVFPATEPVLTQLDTGESSISKPIVPLSDEIERASAANAPKMLRALGSYWKTMYATLLSSLNKADITTTSDHIVSEHSQPSNPGDFQLSRESREFASIRPLQVKRRFTRSHRRSQRKIFIPASDAYADPRPPSKSKSKSTRSDGRRSRTRSSRRLS